MLRNLVQYENNSMHSPHPTNDGHHNRKPFDYKKFFVNLLILVAVVSMPWEFVRLYQREVAKRASHAAQGAPDECTTGSVSLIQTLKSFLHWQFSWSNTNHCEDYYYVLLVDPLWELSPLLVVSSAVTRCVLHPMELLFSGLGRSFRAFFAEIPIQWQPLLLVILTMILLVVILMTCSYRLHIPLLFKIEPKTPVYVQDIKHSNINQNSSYMQMLDTPTNLSGSHIKNGYSENVYQPKKIQNGELFFNAKYIKDEIIIDDSPPEVSIKQTYAEKRKLFYNDTPSLRRDKISKGKDSPKKATKTTRSRKTQKYEEDPNYSDEY
ncbi:hypothetical protein SNE40_021397 [Patella caerulea]|uniref:Chloride channel CLIC-like protein 1 n=1 Tax=Patella caerulea TaxID=87958 RepID=A0AAN8GB62_PATCE